MHLETLTEETTIGHLTRIPLGTGRTAVMHAYSEEIAAEVVKRWNAHADLLEACEAACELLVELGADGEPGDMPSPTLEEIRAAIAKARGV